MHKNINPLKDILLSFLVCPIKDVIFSLNKKSSLTLYKYYIFSLHLTHKTTPPKSHKCDIFCGTEKVCILLSVPKNRNFLFLKNFFLSNEVASISLLLYQFCIKNSALSKIYTFGDKANILYC